MRQRAASGGVTAGIWVLKRPRKPPRPPTKGRAEQLCGAKLRRAPSGGGRLYMREFSTNAETGQQKRPLLSSCSCRSKADVAAFNLPISFRRQQNAAVRGILLPSHPRRTFCPLALVRARQAPAFQADAGSAARLPVSGFAADACNSPNCRRAPLSMTLPLQQTSLSSSSFQLSGKPR